jgi:hypothetical protein
VTFATLEEVSFSLRVLSDIQHSAEHFSVGLFAFNRVEILFEHHLLSLLMLLMKEYFSEFGLLPQEIADLPDNFGILEVEGERKVEEESDQNEKLDHSRINNL